MPKVYVTKEFEFEACHHLTHYVGNCANLHGHTYKLQVTVSGEIPSPEQITEEMYAEDSMVLDFKLLKRVVKDHILDTHDHSNLNDLYVQSTAEVMVVSMYQILREKLPKDVEIENVKLWETSTSFAEYKGE